MTKRKFALLQTVLLPNQILCFQEKLLKAYFESSYFNLRKDYSKLDFDVLKKQILVRI